MTFPVYKIGVTFSEMPKHVSVYLQLADCQIRCSGCHSKELWQPTKGIDLSEIKEKILNYKDMGSNMLIIFGDTNNNIELKDFKVLLKELSDILPICIFSGSYGYNKELLKYISYLKLGPYEDDKGGLSSDITNQTMYKVENNKLVDVTKELFKGR